MAIKFNWKEYDYLAHEFIPIYNCSINGGWSRCIKCDVKVYVDPGYFGNELKYWQDDIFHDLTINQKGPVVDFNLTCAEVIIKKIIE